MDNITMLPACRDNTNKMKIKFTLLSLAIVVLLNSCQQSKTSEAKGESASNTNGMDRTVLPVKEPDYPFDTTLDARNAKAPARFEVKAPPKAPNVVVVLIDDQGFGLRTSHAGVDGFRHQQPIDKSNRVEESSKEYRVSCESVQKGHKPTHGGPLPSRSTSAA